MPVSRTRKLSSNDREHSPNAVVLVVDDEPGVVNIIKRVLLAADYYVLTAEDYPSARQCLESIRVDVILTDINMPGRSGIDLLHHCRREKPDIEVILITGRPSLRDAVETVRAGAYDYLEKPCPPSQIRNRVQEAFDRRRKRLRNVGKTVGAGAHVGNGIRIIRTLGRGSTGIVLLVEKNDTPFALKVLQRWHADASLEECIDRFKREALVLSRVKHPNVVRIFDYDLEPSSQHPSILMEYIDGTDLESLLGRGNLGLSTKVELIRQITAGLAAVHKHNIIHRDIKPPNILITEDFQAKLTDFGVARLAKSSLTGNGDVLGSPGYMAPEILRGGKPDKRADIFSLGVLAYTVITERSPFRGENVPSIIESTCSDYPTPPATLDPDVPALLSDMVMKMLEKRPRKRFRSADNVLAALQGVQAEMAGSA